MIPEKCFFYWSCCGEHPAESMADARAQLETHEKEAHKGKLIGAYGYRLKEAE